jgi:hypothetical protein
MRNARLELAQDYLPLEPESSASTNSASSAGYDAVNHYPTNIKIFQDCPEGLSRWGKTRNSERILVRSQKIKIEYTILCRIRPFLSGIADKICSFLWTL